jgi:protein O-GlcNAc transferase
MAKKNKKAKKKHAPGPPGAFPRHRILQQAMAFHQAGRLAQAEALYRQILLAEPNHPEVLHYLGMLAQQVGKNEIAVEFISKALTRRPDYIEAYNSLGNALQASGQPDEAAVSYRRALSLKPDYAEAHYNLGNALRAQGKPDEAADCYRRAFAVKPNYVEAGYNLGILLQTAGKPEEAEAAFRRVLAVKPDFVGAHNNLGLILQTQNKLDEAVASYQKALTLKPDFAEAYNNLGNVLHAQGKTDEAEASYRRALTLRPDYVEAHTNLGIELQAQGKLDEAAARYRQALRLKPDFVDAHNNLGMILQDQGRLDEAIASFRQVLALQPDFAEAHSNLLLCLNYLPKQSIALYLDEARHYGRQAAGRVSEPYSDWTCAARPDRLRVGLVSGDLRSHSVGYFLEDFLAHIDPTQIELVAYPTNKAEDELTARIRPRFTAWKPLAGMDDATAARLIHGDGVHILFDLSGHTNDNRLPVFAWKPAPVQVSWLGYSASTGLGEMDYLLADPYVVPPGAEAYFTETIWRLPESYLCFSPPPSTVEVGPLPALKEGRITFGCFNNPTKMNDAVVALWAKVLHAVPDSRLFLKSKRFANPMICETTRQRFTACGIVQERLLLEGFVRRRQEHLATYNRVDIALDPFPYNGTTTSAEGLWMGVPFITCRGDRFVSRVGESIAQNTGLADWIAMDDEDYVAKAVAHAADLQKLAGLRAGLRRQVSASPVFNGPGFARNFEAALWGMWRSFQKERKRGRVE